MICIKKAIFLVLLVLVFTIGYAQDDEHIETDRPNETEVPYTVPRKYVQIETGIYVEKTSSLNDLVSHPSALFKYGVSKRIELRLETKWSTFTDHLPLNDKSTTGIEPIEIGFKAALLEGRKWIPKTAISFQTGIPDLASKELKAEKLAPRIRLSMQNELTEKLSLTYNIGTEWDGTDTTPEWLYTFSPGVDIGKNWHVFTELYSFFRKSENPKSVLDGGAEYFINRNFSLDVCSGFGLSKAAPDFFVTVGGSVRFK